ncbi:uncharacterized protein LOC117644267 [Thrips palmi]|uniref:Uncharacterized protein LOC117644267 n=1 Tax=Thrips palmi TaxID=161013 RepID=A0A6P8YQ93_THRPL|nr:uncharacterized protein LOC117644267 [Thrips palmi]
MDNTRWYADLRKCRRCGTSKKQTLACSRCKSVYYCSKEHQIEDWKSHRDSCGYYKVCREPSKPTCLVATRKIPKGTTIFKSEAIAIGPTGLEPACLGCLRPMIYDVMSYQCEGCGWPIDVQCQKSPLHQLECSVLQNAGFKFDKEAFLKKGGVWKDSSVWRADFRFIGFSMLVLRVLLSNRMPKLLELDAPDNHNVSLHAERSRALLEGVSLFIRNHLKLQQYDHDTICTITKVLQQALVPVTVLDDCFSLNEPRCGYGAHDSDVYYMQHSCYPNIHMLETSAEPTITYAIANVDIEPGDKLTVNKFCCNLMVSTWTRQLNYVSLTQNPCTCERCMDPTELGLHLGSVTCKKCFAMTTPNTKDWGKCNKCGYSMTPGDVGPIAFEFTKSFAACKEPNDFVKLIDTYSGPEDLFHPNHGLILSAKEAYCQSIHTNSLNKGAAFELGSRDRDQFYNYTKDLTAVSAKLKMAQREDLLYIRWLEVHSRYIIRQWFVGNITNVEAQDLIKLLMVEYREKGLAKPAHRFTELLHRNMTIEIHNHLVRLQIAERDKED